VNNSGSSMEKKIIEHFGNRLRVRVCGILEEDDRILLVRHHALGPKGVLWAPPGGGMKFGSNAEQNLIREFKEETGLDISVEEFLMVHEFLSSPLHAIELFFRVKRTGGELILGHDPEMGIGDQIIKEIRFVPITELLSFDREIVHNALSELVHFKPVRSSSFYSKFEQNQ